MTRKEKKEHEERMRKIHEENMAIVQTGKCPRCGQPLKRNLALTGWWQCVCYASLPMRDPKYKDLPSCDFQCFVE